MSSKAASARTHHTCSLAFPVLFRAALAARPHMLHMPARSMCSSRPRSPMHNRPSTTPRMRELTHAPCVQLIHYARSICSRASQDEVLVRNCGHCLKAAHQTLLIMLARVLALELLARQFEELRARRLVVGKSAAWIARVLPLRAPIGRGRPAIRFGGLAWLAHRGGCA